MNKPYFKRPLSFLLALIMVIGLVPFSVNTASSATPLASTDYTSKVADPSTMNDWTKWFGPTKLTTENAGGIWTDKSVFTDASAFTGTGVSLLDEDGFLVALSAIASNLTIEGKQYSPTDTLLVLDVSGSLANSSLDDEMTDAANQSIATLLSDNDYNRVGVIAYSGGSATTLLPLGRYTTQNDIYFNNSNNQISVNRNVRIEGTNQRPSSAQVSVTGATYIQSGVIEAINTFLEEEGNTTVNDPVLGELSRVPVVVLMSDGAPTRGTTAFTNPGNYQFGDGSNTTAALGFVTQLSLAYAKHTIEEAYNSKALFYTLGLGVGSNETATSVLNPTNSSTAIDAFWEQYNAASVGGTVTVHREIEEADWWWEEDEEILYNVTKIATALDQNYSNGYFAVDGTTSELESGLLKAFENIVKQIELQSQFFPTLVEESEHLSGYVSFVDKIGKYMNVTDFKGILINNQLHTGAAFASNLSKLGTPAAPTALGDEFFNSVKERLGITADEARTLIQMAFDHGQLAYNATTGAYSNYIGWYADADGKFLGFWYDGITTMSSGAATIVKSYGYLGEVDEAHGVTESDMMYATVRVMTDIATGDETVAFAVPAALIPTVTYNVSLDDKGALTNLTVTGATNPIRLVYEIALDERIDEITVKSIATHPEYVANHINANGEYEFFTNKYDHDLVTSYGTNNTYAYFRPSTQNDRYYYTTDSPIYTDTNGTLYTGTSAPSTTGTYYRGSKVYSLVGGSYQTTTLYEKISATSLAKAIQHTGESTWYVPAGTVHTYVENFNTPKTANNTNTLTWSDIPFVDAQYTYYVGAVLGNNGRIVVNPATGIKITKTVAETSTNENANTSFEFVITNKTNAADNNTYKTYHVDAQDNVTESTITFSAGKATVSLKDGEAFYISGMTAGDVFNVTETESYYYICTNSSIDLTVVNQSLATAAFVNTARGSGNLTVAKEINHQLGTDYTIPADKKFNFTVTLSGLDLAGKTFTATHSGDTAVAAVTVGDDGSFSFTLGHDEEFEVYGLPEGTVATVVETNIPTGFSAAYNENNAAGDGIVTIGKGATVMVEVVNTYTATPVTVGTQISASVPKNFLHADNTPVDNWGTQTFTAKLQKFDGEKWVDLETATATNANRVFTFDLSNETYTAAGVYSYQIFEVIPAESDRGTILYDRTYHTFSVTVGDTDMDGALEILKVISEHNGQEFTKDTNGTWAIPASFTNIQELIVPAVVEIPIQKALTNNSESTLVSLSGYQFGLYTDESCTMAATIGNGIQKLELAHTDNVGEGWIDIIIDKEGDYTFYIKEIAGSTSGMEYSTQVVKVTIKVTMASGRLSAAVTYDAAINSENELIFTNVYNPTPATLNIDVRKVLNGRTLGADEFSFTLKSEDGSYSETVKNKADGDVPFTDLSFDKVGTYVYYVNEVIPADADKLGGVTYDTATHKVIVTVVDNGGALSASYVVEDIAENYIIFTNTYAATPVEHTVEGTKILEGRVLLNDEFGFTLIPCDENGNTVSGAPILQARNFSDGSFSFSSLKFTAPGTYYYIAAEKQENTALGVKYDTTEYIIQIDIKDNLKGALEIESVNTIVKLARAASSNKLVFTNVYVPAPTSSNIGGTKTYTTEINGTVESLDLSKTSFAFNLYNSDASWNLGSHIQTVHNNAAGAFSFDQLTFDKVGTYYYVVTEQHGGQIINGIVYDNTAYRVKIVVTDNLTGALSASVTIYDDNDIPKNDIAFANAYKITTNAQVVIEGQKYLEGLTLKDGDFSFVIIDITENTSNTTPLETVKNNANGVFAFSAITYEKPGTYTYIVKEVNGGQTINGITYDNTSYTVTVKVTDNGAGGLLTEVTGAENIEFTNNYVPSSTAGNIGGNKTYTTEINGKVENLDLSKTPFTFVLYHSDASWNLGEHIESVMNNADGSFAFSELKFDKAGEYFYLVKEFNGGQTINGIVYDGATYRVKIVVTDNLTGALGATVTVYDSSNNTVSGIAFANSYVITNSAEVVIDGHKHLHGLELKTGDFSFILKDSSGKEIETVKNDANGSFAFAALTYTVPGTYTYTVEEVNGGQTINGITYDKTVYTVIVKVTDNGMGGLITEVSGAENIVFNNNYLPSSTSANIGGKKTYTTEINGKLENLDLSKTSFTFGLYNSDASWTLGEHIESVKNNADGSFAFSELKFDKAGEYFYLVKELHGGQTINGIVYDGTTYRVKIVVTDNLTGALGATVTVYDVSGNAVSSIAFANSYEITTSAEVLIDGSKILHGLTLKAGDFSFVLKDSSGNAIETVKNDANGNFAFTVLTYTAPGTYTYTVEEVNGGQTINGITYDKTVYTVTVKVNDNGMGGLITEVTGAEGIVFTNNYVPSSTSGNIGGNKTYTTEINGKVENLDLSKTSFTFNLYRSDSSWNLGEHIESVNNKANGSFAFTELKFDKAGEYFYLVKELHGGQTVNGIVYDSAVYRVKIVVTDNLTGALGATVSIYDANNAAVNAIAFANSYKITNGAEALIDGSKILHGLTLKAGDFSFVLKDANGKEIETVKNDANGNFAFTVLTYTAPGTYTYTVEEVNGGQTINGITYDKTVYTVTVKVTDNGAGGLLTEVTGAEGIVFTNNYVPSSTSANIGGKKTYTTEINGNLENLDLSKTTFTFNLYNSDASWTLGEHIETVKNAADGSFAFTELKFDKAGEYFYLVKELHGGQTINGVVYDGATYRVKIVVTDNLTGALGATVTVYDASGNAVSSVAFANSYKITTNTQVVIDGQKYLHGLTLKDGDFSFVIIDTTANASNTTPLQTVKNNANGVFTFSAITYEKPGTYTYIVKEVNGGQTINGITYDNTSYTVTVKVTDNGMGGLIAEVTGAENIVFTNNYDPSSTSANVGGKKTYTTEINGKVENLDLSKNPFTFILYQSDASWTLGEHIESVKNAADGSFAFTELKFDKAGEYFYLVKEYHGGQTLNGIVYDGATYRVKIVVTDDLTGALSATVSIYDATGAAVSSIAFANSYVITNNTEVVIDGHKHLHGIELKAGDFRFVLKDANGKEIETVKNDASGKFAFAALTYTDPGTYTYTVEEVNGGKTVNGITYDKTVYTVTVKVTDNGSGALVAEVSGAENIVFTNNYVPTSTTANISGNKTYTTEKDGKVENLDLSKITFTFHLYNSDANWTLGEHIESVNNKADGSFAFTELKFDKAGEYFYLVKELHGGQTINGIVYDGTVYRVKIVVTDNLLGALEATVSIYDANNAAVNAIAFANSYKITNSAEAIIDGSKILHGLTLNAGDFSFVLKDANGKEIETVKNDANGNFAFTVISYTAPGTYTYTVEEVNGGQTINGITYDNTVYTVTVQVTDNGMGGLITEVTGAEGIVFTNTYKAASAKVSFSGTKVLEGRKLEADEFTFTIVDANGNVIESVRNAADGSFKFTDLEFTEAKEYTYTVNEASGFVGGITYDTTVYNVVVTVTDNGKGQLVASVKLNGSAVNAEPAATVAVTGITFNNKYSTKDTSVTFNGNKTLVGRNLKEGEFSFVLKDSAGNAIETVKVRADGSFSFSSISYDKSNVGTYTYTVSEVIPDNANKLAGVTYDETVYTITVKVTDNGKGELQTTVTGADNISFRNVYNASPAEIHFSGIKHLTGRELTAGEFGFKLVLEDSTGAVIETVYNSADGNFEFHPLKFDTVGVFEYSIHEVTPAVTNGVTYDTTKYTVTVTVTYDNVLGEYKAEITKIMANGKDVTGQTIVFNNSYAPASSAPVTISGNKLLSGGNIADFDGKFSFVLIGIGVKETVTNNANGSFTFPSITYDKAGTYNYTVNEVKGDQNGVTYDDTVYNITVTVTDNGSGKLVASVSGAESIVFRNTYAAAPGKVTFTGTKKLEGRPLVAGDFSFMLKDANGNVIETVTNNADGSFSFSTITYTTPGVYNYRVEELIGTQTNVEYDKTVYNITVTVTDKNGTLKCTTTGASNIVFNNKYNVVPTYVQLRGMKNLEGRALREGEFSFVLTDVTDPNNPVVVETVKNQANGSFVFTAMEYRLPGVYSYTIHEFDDNLGGVTYDKKVYNILVVVTDDGIGNLSNNVSATYIVQELYSITAYPVALDRIVFNNKYESLAASVQFFGEKNLIGRDLHAGEFTFELKDLSGNLIESVTNDANGEFRFSSIVYTKPGYYYYEVSEVNNGLGGITYDTSAIKIEVVVVDDGFGKLSAVFSTAQELEFTNFYHAEPATVQLSAEKELYGRELREGEFSFKLLEASGHEIGTVENNADGSIKFPELKYVTEGTYTYYISEVKGDLKGVTYDETVHTVVVKITDNGRGALVATVEGGEDIVFENRYVAAPTTVALGGTKILEGRDLIAGEFTFVMKNSLGNVVETTTNDAEGRFDFSDSRYIVPGTYIYTICEVAGDEVGMAYDAREYTILIKITDNGEGQLVATLSNSAYNIEFVNVYTAPEDTTEIPEETTSPEETTETPEETTAPEETTETPEETTAPEETTEVPEVTTAPEETTSPEETTGVSGDTTTAPEETTEIPEITTEEPVVTTTPEETTNPEDTDQPWSPDTRDNANIIIWFGAIFAAFCTTAGVLFSKKRNDNENE